MVNVAGRSRGCSTCRRRRIKCDEGRPICQRCQHGGFHCDGPRSPAFVAATIVKSRRTSKPAIAGQGQQVGSPATPERKNAISDLRWRWNECEVFLCYTRKYLYPGGPIDLGIQDLKLGNPLPGSRASCANAPVFSQAITSFATVFFGTQHGQKTILAQGLAAHGAALKRLNQALAEPSYCLRDEILIAVITLAMLEMFVPSGPNGYVKHMAGAERLLELRGPASLVNCSARSASLYKGLRHMILFSALRARKPTILARPEWKRVLRVDCSPDDLEEQDLHDVVADCSVLIAGCDMLNARLRSNDHVGVGVDEIEKFKGRANALLDYLSAWKARWDRHEKNTYYMDHQDSAYLPSARVSGACIDLNSDSYIYRVKSDSTARMLMFYNAALIYVLDILISLTPTPPDTGIEARLSQMPSQAIGGLGYQARASIASGDYLTAKHFAALEIARCITDYLDKKRARLDPQFTSPAVQWAITTAWKAHGGHDTAERRWMMTLLARDDGQTIANGVWDT